MKLIITFLLNALVYPLGLSMNITSPMMPGARAPRMAMPTTPIAPATMPGAAPQMMGMPPAAQTQPQMTTAPMPGAYNAAVPQNGAQALVSINLNSPEIQKYKQELDAISTSLQQLDQLKNNLKSDLHDLDIKLATAQQQNEESKKISYEILQQTTNQQAQTMLAKVQDNLKKIQELQQFVQMTFSLSFNKKITDTKLLMASVTTMIQQLEAKVGIMPNATTQPQQQPIIPVPQPQQPLQSPVQPKNPQTFLSGIKDNSAALTAWLIRQTKQLTDWILTPADTDVKKKKTIDNQISVTLPYTEQPVILPPIQLPFVAGMSLENQIKTYLTSLNNNVQSIDQKRIEFSEQYHDIKMSYKAIQAKLESCNLLKSYINLVNKQKSDKNKETDVPLWRKLAEHGFSRVLDLMVFTVHYTKIGIIKIYHYFFSHAVQEFSDDVKEKLKEMETPK